MQGSDLFVQVLGEDIHLVAVMTGIAPQLHLSQGLIGKGVGHHKARVSHGATKVDQAAFGQNNNLAALNGVNIDLRLDCVLGRSVIFV